MRLSSTVMEIWRLKYNGVTTLTFWGHVTSSVTWPFDSRSSTSYRWSIVTMRLCCTVMEIWSLQCWTDARTDGRTNAKVIFILCPMLLHCIGQTISNQEKRGKGKREKKQKKTEEREMGKRSLKRQARVSWFHASPSSDVGEPGARQPVSRRFVADWRRACWGG